MKHDCITCLCNIDYRRLPVEVDWLIYMRQNLRSRKAYELKEKK